MKISPVKLHNICESHRVDKKEVLLRLSKLPKTRYYGSKRKLLGWIYENLRHLEFTNVLDAFGGTASVSLLFNAMGKHVTFHDSLTCNEVSARVLLSDKNIIDEIEPFNKFIDSIEPLEGFIAKTFSDMYYLDEENEWLDGAVKKINNLDSNEERNLYFYCLFQACLKKRPFNLFHRANLNLRTKTGIKRSFGNLTTWNKPFGLLMKESFLDINQAIWKSDNVHTILKPDDASNLKPGYDLVYLDPPYVDLSERSDDYLRRYHFLEGLCRYDEWSSLINRTSRNYSFSNIKHIRDWQKKSTFKERLFGLIDKHKHSIVVLSYVANAYPTQEDLIKYFNSKFKRVTISSQQYNHALAKGKRMELLIIGSS